MMDYRLLYSETSRKQIKALHPDIKPVIKSRLQKLKSNPYTSKELQRELSGYYSLRARRFRIIYKINGNDKVLEVHSVGHRKDIYEVFRESLVNS